MGSIVKAITKDFEIWTKWIYKMGSIILDAIFRSVRILSVIGGSYEPERR